MKKIGIITYHKFYNYGSMLQAYALQRYLENNKFEAEIIDYSILDRKESKIDILIDRIRRAFIPIKRKTMLFKIKNRSLIEEHKQRFDNFYYKYIKLSKKKYNTEKELKQDLPDYDIYMVGSDQMWNPYIKIRSNAFYLSFVPDNKKKVSYAPSIGGNYISKEYQAEMRKYLQRFEYISCREHNGSGIISKLLNREVTTVLDPTLLIDKKQWLEIAREIPEIKEKYILCYFLGNKKQNIEYADKLGKKLGIKVYHIYTLANDIIDNINYLFNVGPQEFIWLIDNAEYVCTDSFHGTIFSINFNKEFFSFTKRKDGEGSDNNRIYEILKEFNLEKRLILDSNTIEDTQKIDFNEVNNILNEKIKKSKEYIDKVTK